MFQEDYNEAFPDNAVIVYFWPGDNDKKVDHVSLRTRGARGYDLKIISPQQWDSLPNPINEHLDIDERELRLNLRGRLINIQLVAEGIKYRIDKANGEVVEGTITAIDLNLPEGSIRLDMIGTIKWKIVDFLKNRYPESIGETGIYASFYPDTPTKMKSRPGKTKSFDLDKKHHKGQFRKIVVYGLDLNKVEEKFQNFLKNGYSFSFFASSILRIVNTQNCTSLVFNLLQAGGAKLPTMNIVSFDKKVIIYNVTLEIVLELLNINRQINSLNNAQNTAHTLLGTIINANVASILCHRAVLEQFPFLWLKYIYNEKVTYSSFMFIAFTVLRLLREHENSNTVIVASSAISFLLFYFAQHFLYERTLSPRDLYELLEESKKHDGAIYQEQFNAFDIKLSSENNWAVINKIFYGIAGAMYAYVQVGRIEENASFFSVRFLAEFIPHFIGTQFIHFNPDISLIAMLMSLPLISRLSGAQYIQDERNFGFAGLIASIQYATEGFLDSQDFLWAATFYNISSYFMSKQLNNNDVQLLIHGNIIQSRWDKNKPYVVMFGATLISAKLLMNRPAYSGIIMGVALAYYKKYTNNSARLMPEEVNQPQWSKMQLCTLLVYFLIGNELFHQDHAISAGIVMGAGLALVNTQSQANPEADRAENRLPRSTWGKATIAISVGAALIGAGFLAYKNSANIYNAVSGITKHFGR